MSIAKLKKLVPPPKSPVDNGHGQDWAKIEKHLGTKLPQDYKDFIAAYGSGTFAQFYRVLNPFAKAAPMRLADQAKEQSSRMKQIHEEEPDFVPFDAFPKSPGLLVWGNDDNGNDYFWLTEGEPDAWPVVAFDCRGDGAKKHDCTLTGYLTGVMEKKIEPLASGFPEEGDYVFEPHEPA